MIRWPWFLFAAALIGCSDYSVKKDNSKPASKPVSKKSPATAEQPPKKEESQKVLAFKEKVGHFLDEARAGAKLLTLAPSLAGATAKAQQITDLYTHLPDVPSEIDSTGEVARRLKNINGSFAAAEYTVKQRLDFRRLKSLDGVKKAQENCNKISEDIKKFADEIEAKIGL